MKHDLSLEICLYFLNSAWELFEGVDRSKIITHGPQDGCAVSDCSSPHINGQFARLMHELRCYKKDLKETGERDVAV